MSSLFCFARRRTTLPSVSSTDARLAGLELEVAKLQSEVVCLKQLSMRAANSSEPSFSLHTPALAASSSVSVPPSLPLFPLATPSEKISSPPFAPPFTPLVLSSLSPIPHACPTKPTSTSTSTTTTTTTATPSITTSTMTTLTVPTKATRVPSPPIAPPFTPFVNAQKSLLAAPPGDKVDGLSPDGHISTCSLTAALDSLVVKIESPSPSKSASAAALTTPAPRRALRSLTAAGRIPLADCNNLQSRNPPRSSRKPVEKGISLDAILNVKLKAANRSQRKRRTLPTPNAKENVDTFFKDALRMKFKRLREHEEQEEADDLWQTQKKKRPTQSIIEHKGELASR